MAHFNVIVFAKETEIDRLLAPYNQHLYVDWYYNGDVTAREAEHFIEYYNSIGYNINRSNLEDWYTILGPDWDNDRWEFESDGSISRWSNYNPVGKWDYYYVIGRRQPKWTPYAFITPDGEWVGRSKISEYGTKYEEKSIEDWEMVYREAVQKYKKHPKTVLDCHS